MPPNSPDVPARAAGSLRDTESSNEPSWAHASGWSQLSGERRTVSCIVAVLAHVAALPSLLPSLSDTLTECGYPWEVIIVDVGGDEKLRRMLQGWTELPGFWSVLLDEGTSKAQAFTVGLEVARGDAVLVLGGEPPWPLRLLPDAIAQWEVGAQLVYATSDPDTGVISLAHWDQTMVDQMKNSSTPMNLPSASSDFALLDASVVAYLLA
jgi:hypothetical protein